MRRHTVIALKIFGILGALIVGGFMACALWGVSLDLGSMKPRIEAVATSALGEEVRIGGAIRLRLSLWPTIEIEKIRVTSPVSDHLRLVRLFLGKIRLKTVLWPLLKKKIQIRKIEVSNVDLTLRHDERGPPKRVTGEGGRSHESGASWKITMAGQVSLKNARVTYREGTSEKFLTLHLKTCEGDISQDRTADFSLEGDFQSCPFRIQLKAGPFPSSGDVKVPLNVRMSLGSLQGQFSGRLPWPLAGEGMRLDVKIWGRRLDTISRLFGSHWPPIGPCLAEIHFRATRQSYDLSALRFEVGKSRLTGQGRLSFTGNKPVLRVRLRSDLIRLDDFFVKDFSFKGARKQSGAVPSSRNGGRHAISPGAFWPSLRDFLNRWDVTCKIRVKRVIWGRDDLGGAVVKLKCGEGHVRINPVHVRLPGGRIDLQADVHPTRRAVSVDLRARVDRFDWGVIARRARPDTIMGGILSLDVALRSTTNDVRHLMRTARGHFDFMLIPRNFSAGVIDLWAVNLLSAIFEKTEEKEKSKINCLVVRLAMKDGLMKERALYMDTSKMRISGKATIDFKNRRVRILLVPRSKRPEYFSFAVPLRVQGRFDDFRVGVSPVRVVGSAFSFVTSPLHVPIRRLFGKNAPANGRKACEEAWHHRKSGKNRP